MQKMTDVDYTKQGSPACQKKGELHKMTGYTRVTASLQIDRGTWVVRARYKDPTTGKSKQPSFSTKLKAPNNKRKAENMMREIIQRLEQEINSGVSPGINPLFSECVKNWLEDKSHTVKANTLQSYEVYANAYIIPLLGDIRVKNLTRQHIQQYFNRLSSNICANTLKKHRVIIRNTLNKAVLDGIIPSNVADGRGAIELPKGTKFEAKILTEEDVSKLLSAIQLEPEPIRTAMILAITYGLRRSEICGLRWIDVDFNEKVIHIKHTVTSYAGKIIASERTKTAASRRDLCVVESTIPHLKALREWQIEQGINTQMVCPKPNGEPVSPEYLTKVIIRTLKKYGFEGIRLHDLRHTAATMLARRLTPKQVQRYMGHEDIKTTLGIYTHITDSDMLATSQAMNGILESAGFCSERCSESNAT